MSTSDSAIIIGASIAGLLTARVLAPHFKEVLILERDSLPEQAVYRTGTAQAQHAHILLRRGLLGLETLLPGYTQNLLDAGAVMTNASRDWYNFFPMGAFPNFDSDYEFICASRPLIEHTLRNTLLKQFSNVTIREQCIVNSVQFSAEHAPLLIFTERENKAEELRLTADLIADASGRNSHTPTWLQQQGYGKTRTTQVKPWLGYSTRLYNKTTLPPGIRAAIIMAKDPHITRGGVLFPIEKGQYICTLYGFSKDYPPTDEPGFTNYAKSLRSEIIYNALSEANPLTSPKAFVKNECAYHHFAEHKRWPHGFLVMGDAVCSFNPIYGQGITSSVMAAQSLQKLLINGRPENSHWSKTAQRKIVKSYQYPWMIATNEDLRWPKTEGSSGGLLVSVMHHFTNWIGLVATRNSAIAYTYIQVLHMTSTPAALLTPSSLMRLLQDGLRQAIAYLTIKR